MTGLPAERLRRAVVRIVGHDAERTVITGAERIAREVRGRALAEGIVEGQAGILIRLLTTRFGPLPEDVTDRVRTARSAELEQWADRVLVAETLDEVFGGG